METKNIFHTNSCTRDSDGKPPLTLKEAQLERVIKRKITNVSNHLGSYGMGGPGFFGFELRKTSKYPTEWLMLTLWGADEWLLVNDRVLSCDSDEQFVEHYKPIIVNEHSKEVEEQLKTLFVGYSITSFNIQTRSFKMLLKSEGRKNLVLEMPENLLKVPIFGGSKRLREWKNYSENMIDGFIISDDMNINI